MKKLVQAKTKLLLLGVFLVVILLLPFVVPNTYALKVLNNVMLYSVIALRCV